MQRLFRSSSGTDGRAPARSRRAAWLLGVGLVVGMLSWIPARPFVMATEVLVDLSAAPRGSAKDPSASAIDVSVPSERGPVRARLYVPPVAAHRCAVVGHGVHYRGIDEPRLVRFATELSKAGAVVLTPELSDLADYHVTRAGADVLAASVLDLSARCPAGSKVGLIGFSFAGGLALLTATDSRVSPRLAYVASVGGYHQLRRVLTFLLTDTVQTLSGPVHRKAHEYGLVVLIYEHLDLFVPEDDLVVMRESIRAWLEEDRGRAWALASQRSSLRSESLFVALATGETESLKNVLSRALASGSASLEELSPAGKLRRIPVPVYLLHGTGDSVIPPEETMWADKELGDHPHRALVTPLIEHVELDKHFRLADALDLVQFMAGLI